MTHNFVVGLMLALSTQLVLATRRIGHWVLWVQFFLSIYKDDTSTVPSSRTSYVLLLNVSLQLGAPLSIIQPSLAPHSGFRRFCTAFALERVACYALSTYRTCLSIDCSLWRLLYPILGLWNSLVDPEFLSP